uniref:(northern house mosquito) hypothetical protein n=1 Tax=Culex pipiens TaxID=7175 RepID=A0A8D8HGH2_CULPI
MLTVPGKAQDRKRQLARVQKMLQTLVNPGSHVHILAFGAFVNLYQQRLIHTVQILIIHHHRQWNQRKAVRTLAILPFDLANHPPDPFRDFFLHKAHVAMRKQLLDLLVLFERSLRCIQRVSEQVDDLVRTANRENVVQHLQLLLVAQVDLLAAQEPLQLAHFYVRVTFAGLELFDSFGQVERVHFGILKVDFF